MGYLTDEREHIAETLGTVLGVTAHSHLPGRVVPPCAVVIPGSPYIERRDGDPFGSAHAQWEAWIITGSAENDVETTSLDDMLTSAMAALSSEGFLIEQVGEPFIYQVQNANFLAATILTSTGVSFT